MPKHKDKSTFSYPADLVWAAACAAYRTNGGYLKYAEVRDDGKIKKSTNRELVNLYLSDPEHRFTEADYRQGQKCRQDLVNSATIAVLKNRANEWTLLSAQMASLDTVSTDHEIAVITAMPKSHAQNLVREDTDSRLAYCESSPIGQINEQITTAGEVVRSNYSVNYNTFYTTVITHSNHQVFFAYREHIDIGKTIEVRGRVKRHADRATQLSRVKIKEQEAT